jgi:hypothetical protein
MRKMMEVQRRKKLSTPGLPKMFWLLAVTRIREVTAAMGRTMRI